MMAFGLDLIMALNGHFIAIEEAIELSFDELSAIGLAEVMFSSLSLLALIAYFVYWHYGPKLVKNQLLINQLMVLKNEIN